MRSPHSRVGNSAVSAAGYLKSPLEPPPLSSHPSHAGITTMAGPRAKTLMDYNEGQFLEADALNTRL